MKSFDEDRNHKIAKLFLSSLKGAKLEDATGKSDQGVDFWLSSEKEGGQRIAVEVKSFTGNLRKDDLFKKYQSYREWFESRYPSGILMYINGKEAQAYFEIAGNEKIYTLTADTISAQVKKLGDFGSTSLKKMKNKSSKKKKNTSQKENAPKKA